MRIPAVMACIFLAASVAWSQAPIDPGQYYVLQSVTGTTVLGLSRGGDKGGFGLEMVERDPNMPLHELFRFVAAGGANEYRIIAASFQSALTGAGKGQMIIESPVSEESRQVVVVEEVGNQVVRLRFRYSNLYVAGLGGSTKAGTVVGESQPQVSGDSASDRFRLVPARTVAEVDPRWRFDQPTLDTGVYYAIVSKLSGLRLNIRDDSDQSGKDLYQDGDGRTRPSGEFRFTPAGQGLYRIAILQSGKALSAALNGKEGGAFVQADPANDPKQLLRVKRLADGLVKLVAAYSGRCMVVEADSTWHGTTMREGTERNHGNEVFELLPQGDAAREEVALQARKLLQEGSRLAQAHNGADADQAILKAVALAPEDGALLSDAGRLLEQIGSDDHAISTLERAIVSTGFASQSLRELFDLYWKRKEWDSAVAVADKAIAYWQQQVSSRPGSDSPRNELVEAWGIKANAYNQRQDWDRAIQTADAGFAFDPHTRNSQLIWAKGAALRGRFDSTWTARRWADDLALADALVAYWKERLGDDAQSSDVRNQVVEGYGIKANTFDQMADWQHALQTADAGFAFDPTTRNGQLIYARAEALHVTAGLAVASRDYAAAQKLIDDAIATYQRDPKADRSSGRLHDLLSVRQLLTTKRGIMKVAPASTQRVLAMIVTGIDIDQTVNGKHVQVTDGFPEAARQRLRAGQGWYGLYVECATGGKLSIEFKNVDVGIAKRVSSEGLTQIEIESITPSISPLIYEYQNYDTYAFYWNGASSGLNGGTGWGGGLWPMTLAGVKIGQPRGYTVMATNPEMYGVFDGLLHHEYGHVLEVVADVGFVHCATLSDADRKRLLDLGWDGDCGDVYDWFLGSFMKGKYADMNWATRYPAKVSRAEFDAMMKLYQASASGTDSTKMKD